MVHSCGCIRDRNQDLWGPDAQEFRPERWFGMSDRVESPVGVYGTVYDHAWNVGGVIEY